MEPTSRVELLTYSLPCLSAFGGELPRLRGADIGNRTRDLILTMDALYQLSYIGTSAGRSTN